MIIVNIIISLLGMLCYLFAIIDFAGIFFQYDLTGVPWSPIVASFIGSFLMHIGNPDEDLEETKEHFRQLFKEKWEKGEISDEQYQNVTEVINDDQKFALFVAKFNEKSREDEEKENLEPETETNTEDTENTEDLEDLEPEIMPEAEANIKNLDSEVKKALDLKFASEEISEQQYISKIRFLSTNQ